MGAKEISALQPIFKENNVRLIGVGVESLGVEEFIEGKFFDGGNNWRFPKYSSIRTWNTITTSLALSRTFRRYRQADVQINGIPEIFLSVAVLALQIQKVD